MKIQHMLFSLCFSEEDDDEEEVEGEEDDEVEAEVSGK